MKINTKKFKILLYFFKPYKIQVSFVFVTMFVASTLEVINIAALYPIINYGLKIESTNIFMKYFESVMQYFNPTNPFFTSCVFLMIASLLLAIAKLVHKYAASKLLIDIIRSTQEGIVKKFSIADYDFFVKNEQGKLIYSSTISPERTTHAIYSLNLFAYHMVDAIFILSFLIVLSPEATGLVIILGSIYGLIVRKIIGKIIKKYAKESVEANQNKNIILNELISGVKAIKIAQAFHAWIDRFSDTMDKWARSKLNLLMGSEVPAVSVRFLFFFLLATAGVFLSQKSQGEILILLPLFGTYVIAANRFLPTISNLGSSLMTIMECMPNVEIVHELATKQFKLDICGTKQNCNFNHNISLDGIDFKYDDMDENLLDNLSFSIPRKQITAIVGPSGSGKTTIINLLLKLYRPINGAVKIDDVNIFDYDNDAYLSKIGYVGQEPFIFNASFTDNITFGLENCSDEDVETAAKLANAHEFIMSSKEQYGTLVGDVGVKLSGGQRQRIAIARALLRKPEIIILDEATSSLDNISEVKIQEAINNISTHTTIFIVAHRLSTIQNANKIIVLDKGRIAEQGTHEELLENHNLYYNLYQRNSDSSEDAIST